MADKGDIEARLAVLEEQIGKIGLAASQLALALGTLNASFSRDSGVTPDEAEQMHSTINDRMRVVQGFLLGEWPAEEPPRQDAPPL